MGKAQSYEYRPKYTVERARSHIIAKHQRITSFLRDILYTTARIPIALSNIISSYLLLDPRILDMLTAPCEFSIKKQYCVNLCELRYIASIDAKTDEISIRLDDIIHFAIPGPIVSSRDTEGDALIAIFGRAKLHLSHKMTSNHDPWPNLHARLLDLILRKFEKWLESHKLHD